MNESDTESDRFHPTQAHPIVDITNRTQKKPEGLVCPTCGHLAVDEDDLIGKTCPKCLQLWLEQKHVQQMVPIHELKEDRDSALVPTIKIPVENQDEKTTRVLGVKIHGDTTETNVKKKESDSYYNIPGLDIDN